MFGEMERYMLVAHHVGSLLLKYTAGLDSIPTVVRYQIEDKEELESST